MGEVYRAQDTRLDRTVAIKVLAAALTGTAAGRQRFEREARAVSALSHPNICALFDVGQQDGIDFLVMEFLEGESLAQRIAKGALPSEQLLRIAIEVADALDKAHRRGLVHRDLKPGNVMLTKTGAKLLDFGLAKSTGLGAAGAGLTASPTLSNPLTAEGAIVGTFQYMAPEQLEGKEADARSDIFSFGAMLYEVATGKKAFEGKSQASLIASILDREPAPMSAIQPLVPVPLERVVKTCLAKDPDARFQTMHDVKLQLSWILEAGAQTGLQAAAPAPVARRGRLREHIALAATGILAVACAVLGFLYWRAANVQSPVIRAFIPPPEKATYQSTAFTGGPATISPDGTKLAFVARRADGINLIFVRALDSLVAQPLAGTENATYHFWSPDGRSLAFFANNKLKKIDASGGPSLTLTDAPNGRGGTWNRDGVILFSPSSNSGLIRVAAAGGATTPVIELDIKRGESTYRWPSFLPDGKHFLYLARVGLGGFSAGENTAIRVASLDGKVNVDLVRARSNAVYASGYLLYARESTLMAQPFNPVRLQFTGDAFPVAEQLQYDGAFSRAVFSASETGILAYHSGDAVIGAKLLWLDRNGKPTSQLGDQAVMFDVRLSPDAKSLAINISDPRLGPPDIWIYDVARGLRTRFTFDPSNDGLPVWSPDGSRIVFRSNRKGPYDLYIKKFAGSEPEELLLESDRYKYPRSWSRDGRYVLFEILESQTNFDIWVLPMTGEKKPFLFLQTKFSESEAEFSPDGRWVAYTSDESGREEVYVAPFPGPGRKWQISTNGGSWPHWRRDGREIYYYRAEAANYITAVQVGARGDTFEVGTTKSLFEIPASPLGTVYDVTGNGQRFLINTLVQPQSSAPITLVVNWTAGLKK